MIGIGVLAVAAQWMWDPIKATVDYIQDMHPRVRALSMIMLAIAILIFVGLVFSTMLWDHIRATSGPFLAEALVAPYSMGVRPLPLAEADVEAMVPASLGSYTLWVEPEAEATAATDTTLVAQEAGLVPGAAAETAPTPQEERTARLLEREESPLGACLMSSLDGDVSVCDTPFLSLAATSGIYLGNNDRVDLFVARFRDAEKATAAINNLRDHARAIGRIGNFVMGGVGEVDYFYSFSPGWVSFSWARENWVFTMSSTSFEDLEAVVEAFPY